MATYGFGANYDGDDVVQDFVTASGAYIGYEPVDAPTLHAILRQIEVGDFVFLKSFPPSQGLRIKAVGIVTDVTDVQLRRQMGYGVDVIWLDAHLHEVGRLDDRADNMRGGTLFREYSPSVINRVIDIVRGQAR